jgi:hypothetical protein
LTCWRIEAQGRTGKRNPGAVLAFQVRESLWKVMKLLSWKLWGRFQAVRLKIRMSSPSKQIEGYWNPISFISYSERFITSASLFQWTKSREEYRASTVLPGKGFPQA